MKAVVVVHKETLGKMKLGCKGCERVEWWCFESCHVTPELQLIFSKAALGGPFPSPPSPADCCLCRLYMCEQSHWCSHLPLPPSFPGSISFSKYTNICIWIDRVPALKSFPETDYLCRSLQWCGEGEKPRFKNIYHITGAVDIMGWKWCKARSGDSSYPGECFSIKLIPPSHAFLMGKSFRLSGRRIVEAFAFRWSHSVKAGACSKAWDGFWQLNLYILMSSVVGGLGCGSSLRLVLLREQS